MYSYQNSLMSGFSKQARNRLTSTGYLIYVAGYSGHGNQLATNEILVTATYSSSCWRLLQNFLEPLFMCHLA